MQKTIDFFMKNKENFYKDLYDLLKIKSVTKERDECTRVADWLLNYTTEFFDSLLIETEGNPIILSKLKKTDNSKPSILFYGHYDVQPAEPLEKWESFPFDPTIRNDRLYGRGVGDNKGQFFSHLIAIKSIIATEGIEALPNIYFFFDGDEEAGSPYVESVLLNQIDYFSEIDFVYISDGSAHNTWKPGIAFGTRGILMLNLKLNYANDDRHSGNYSFQPNPIFDMFKIIQTMRDDKADCFIEGFYNDVNPPDINDKEALRKLEVDLEKLKKAMGIPFFSGNDSNIFERQMFKPTINICGIQSGGVLENTKTIIPAEVVVDLDFRLVVNQNPEKIKQLVIDHLEKLKENREFSLIMNRLKFSFKSHFFPFKTNVNNKWTEPILQALKLGFDIKEPIKVPVLGGSLPTYHFQNILSKPVFIVPYAQPDENNHSPNENMMLSWLESGIKTSIHLLNILNNQ